MLFKQATEARPDNAILWNNLGRAVPGGQELPRGDAGPGEGRPAAAGIRQGPPEPGRRLPGRQASTKKRRPSTSSALQLFPNYADAVFNLGILYLDADKMPNMDLFAKENTAIQYFQQYKQMMGGTLPPADPADGYIAEAQDKIKKEEKRLERLKKQQEREAARAAKKAADDAKKAAAASRRRPAPGAPPAPGACARRRAPPPAPARARPPRRAARGTRRASQVEEPRMRRYSEPRRSLPLALTLARRSLLARARRRSRRAPAAAPRRGRGAPARRARRRGRRAQGQGRARRRRQEDLPDHRGDPDRGQDPEARGLLLLPEVEHQLRLAGAEAGLHPQDSGQRFAGHRSRQPSRANRRRGN